MKFAKPRIVAKKLQLFEGASVLLAKGNLGLISLGKHATRDVFALIILQVKTQRNLGEAERPETGRSRCSGRYQSVQNLDALFALDGQRVSSTGRLGCSGQVRGVQSLDA